MNQDEINKKLEELYWELCRDCPSAKRCHEECQECDEYQDEYLKIIGEN